MEGLPPIEPHKEGRKGGQGLFMVIPTEEQAYKPGQP